MIRIFQIKITLLLLLFTILFTISCGNSEEIPLNEEENKPEIPVNTSVTNSSKLPVTEISPSPTTEAKNKSMPKNNEKKRVCYAKGWKKLNPNRF